MQPCFLLEKVKKQHHPVLIPKLNNLPDDAVKRAAADRDLERRYRLLYHAVQFARFEAADEAFRKKRRFIAMADYGADTEQRIWSFGKPHRPVIKASKML